MDSTNCTPHIIDSPTQVEKEIHNKAWRTPYTRIVFDVIFIHPNKPSISTGLEAAQFMEMDLCLRDREKIKFARQAGGTNTLTNCTLSVDGVIGEFIDNKTASSPYQWAHMTN
jgi:hypothetical protein